MSSPPAQRCNKQMGCKLICNCSHPDLIHDARLMTRMGASPPPRLAFYSEERRRATERLTELESELDVLNDKLDQNRRKLKAQFKIIANLSHDLEPAILAEVTKRCASFSPIRCVPSEILGYIFACMDPPELPDKLEDITRLCLVSKAWNMAVALAPELWTNWRIDTTRHLALSPSSLDYESSTISQNVEKFLSKSMNRQLDLRITNYEISFTDRDVETSLPLLNIITQSLPRWNRFRYQCGVASPGNACFCSHLFNALKMGFALDALEWDPCENWTFPEDQLLPVVNVNKLGTLSLSRSPIPFPLLETPALTDLSLCDLLIDYEDVSNLAESLPNLLILRCNDVIFEETGEEIETAPPVLFQNLRDLYMSYCDPDGESCPQLALTLLLHAPTISKAHRTIECWGSPLQRWALHSEVGKNISVLEFDLDVMFVHGAEREGSPAWSTPSEITDWLGLPNLTTVSLVWNRGSRALPSDERGNNNRLAARLLVTISAVCEEPHRGFCPRLEHLECHGVTCDEPFVGRSGTEAFLLALENFSWNRSRLSDGPDSSTETITCLVSVAWNAATNSAGLPDLVNANWEDMSAFFDEISAETDTNACDLSNEEDIEDSDSEESSRVAEEDEDSDSSWLGEEEKAERAAGEKYLRAITFNSSSHDY